MRVESSIEYSEPTLLTQVSSIVITERHECCAERTKDIEARIGFRRPPFWNTGGDSKHLYNTLCGTFTGPGVTGTTSTITCISGGWCSV